MSFEVLKYILKIKSITGDKIRLWDRHKSIMIPGVLKRKKKSSLRAFTVAPATPVYILPPKCLMKIIISPAIFHPGGVKNCCKFQKFNFFSANFLCRWISGSERNKFEQALKVIPETCQNMAGLLLALPLSPRLKPVPSITNDCFRVP